MLPCLLGLISVLTGRESEGNEGQALVDQEEDPKIVWETSRRSWV